MKALKRILALSFVFFLALSSFAQTDNDEHIIYKEVPRKFRIEDKIKVVNKSPYYIQKIVISLPVNNGFSLIGTLSDIKPTEDESIDLRNERLMKSLRGETLAIKIKGIKTNQNMSEEAIYDFNIQYYCYRDDLVIVVSHKNKSEDNNKSIMDF